MNATETVRLCKVIASLCPAQKWDEDTPTVWYGVLRDLPLTDALESVRRIAQRQTFVAPADIWAEAKRLRAARVEGIDNLPAPNVDPDHVIAYARELVALRQAAASGELDREEYVTTGRTLTGVPGIQPSPLAQRDFDLPSLPRPA